MTAAVRPFSPAHLLKEHGETGVADEIPSLDHNPASQRVRTRRSRRSPVRSLWTCVH